jgi:ABC-2 type transport system ATP-binding protein
LEEAEKVADRISIIDHGKIVINGTSDSIKKSTKAKSLEEAFLKLTGKRIREEPASPKDIMRLNRRVWGR